MKKLLILLLVLFAIKSYSQTKDTNYYYNPKLEIKKENRRTLKEKIIVGVSFVTYTIQMKIIADRQKTIK